MIKALFFAASLQIPSTSAATACALANVLASHMVLQRAPASATVWGFAAAGTKVITSFAGAAFSSAAGSDGVWRQALPPTPANAIGQTISFNCSSGESFAIDDVLFGEVVICGGQCECQRRDSLEQ